MASSPAFRQLGAYLLLSATACGAFWKLHGAAVQADLQQRQEHLVQIRSETADVSAAAKRLERSRHYIVELERRLASAEKGLPWQEDVAGVIRRVSALATGVNLTIRRFNPQPSKVRPPYIELPHRLHAEGTFQNISAFVEGVSRLEPVVQVSDITMRAPQQQTGESPLVVECLASVFVLQERKTTASVVTPVQPSPSSSRRIGLAADPFKSPPGTRPGSSTGGRPSGLRGVLVDEIAVRGILKHGGGLVGMLQAPDKRTYLVRAGEKLFDGSVKEVMGDSITFSRNGGRRLSPDVPREVVKKLRASEGGGQ